MGTRNESYDVVVIGGGMVGASLACALGATGLRIAVVEAVPLSAATQPSYDDRTIALAYGSRRVFETIGVWHAIDAGGVTPIERIHVSDRGHFGVTRLAARDANLPALGYVVENRVLGAALLSVLQASSAIDWICPAAMESISIEPAAASVTIRAGEATRTLTARLVVAADGAHSTVRSAVGIDAERTEYDQSAVVTNVTASRPVTNTAYERFTSTGPLALLPMSKNRYAVVWSARRAQAKELLARPDDEFLAGLQERFGGRLGEFSRLGKRAAYPLALTKVREHARERLVLIGNAAHTVHPVAGQGFNLGLRDVAALAEVLAGAQRCGADLGAAALLERYARWRRRDNLVIANFTNGLIRVFSSDLFPLALARNAGLVAVDLLPGVKRGFIRVTSGMAGKLPRLARGLPL